MVVSYHLFLYIKSNTSLLSLKCSTSKHYRKYDCLISSLLVHTTKHTLIVSRMLNTHGSYGILSHLIMN
jgi:hypothetical protein